MKPYNPKEFTYADAAHLLRRAGFGGNIDEIESLRRLGPSLAVEKLLSFSSFDGTENNPHDLDEQFNAAKDAGRPPNQQVASTIPVAQAWWLYKMRTTREPLKEKMTLFWHGHFVSGLDKVRHGYMLKNQNELFRRLGLGQFETLTLEVAKDPAMLRYLDNNVNTKKKPNENFAREVMELFTMGVHGGYTERDIQEAARAFTGWTFNLRLNGGSGDQIKNPMFVFNQREHDTGNKTVLGKTGNFNGEDIISIVCNHPSTPKYMVTKLWNFFVSPEISASTLEDLSRLWVRSKGNIRDILREIFNSEEFYAPENRFALIKTPLEFVIGSLRASKAQLERQHEMALSGVLSRMAQIPFFPPDVSGWDGDMDWIADTTMLNRLQYAATLSSANLPSARNGNGGGGGGLRKLPSIEWVMGKDLSQTIDMIGQTHLGVKPTDSLRRALETFAKGRNTPEVARGLAYLVMISPQYHLN